MADVFIEHCMSIVLGILVAWITRRISTLKSENEATKAGVQALLRDRMIQAYNHYYEGKGYIPIYARDCFIACWEAYHNLGKNGVMDDIKNKVLSLPTSGGDR